MSQELSVLGISAAITVGIQLTGFAFAYAMQTETFYDILGTSYYVYVMTYCCVLSCDICDDCIECHHHHHQRFQTLLLV